MKNTIISAIFALLVSFAQGANQTNTDSSKAVFYSAFDALKNMLEGKDSLNYEKAVFITENAYYENAFQYEGFKQILDFHTEMINILAAGVKKEYQDKYKTMKLYEQKMFNLNAANWAIYKYVTDTILILNDDVLYLKKYFNYTTDDPYGSVKWENTQLIHLLTDTASKGNCYALSILFKIFSDRLKSDARLVITPHHIYIQNRNGKGDFKNIELATKTFPGDGSIQVLTYTTKTSIMNGMAQRPLNDKEAIALNLIYLAKGFEYKFNDKTNDFLLKCADLAFKHDTLSMNALLLKAEITENKLFQSMKENKITTVVQVRANPKTQKLLTSYEKQLSNLYKCGYREIPKNIQHIILSAIQGNKDGYITTDKTPNPFAEFGQTTRYATLSGGLFDEMHYPVDTIQYFHASLNTKTKKLIEFLPIDTSNHYKVDPVVFALSVDPMAHQFPYLSPYIFAENNPIRYIDLEGLQAVDPVSGAFKKEETKVNTTIFAGARTVTIAQPRLKLSHDYEGKTTSVLYNPHGDKRMSDLALKRVYEGKFSGLLAGATGTLRELGENFRTASVEYSGVLAAQNPTLDAAKASSDQGYGKVFRHIASQGLLTKLYGADFTKAVGDFYDRINPNDPIDISYRDLLNNAYGREFGSNYEGGFDTPEGIANYLNAAAEYVNKTFNIEGGTTPFKADSPAVLDIYKTLGGKQEKKDE